MTAWYRLYCGQDHDGARGAAADVLAIAAKLDAQVLHYSVMPLTLEGLHDRFDDTPSVGADGLFVLSNGSPFVFAKGKHAGKELGEIASVSPDYLD